MIHKLTVILFTLALSVMPLMTHAQSKTIEWKVPSVTCKSCSFKIRKGLKDFPGVSDVKVDVETKKIKFTCSSCNESDVKSKIIELGYPVET